MKKSNIAEELGISVNLDYKANKDVEKLFKDRQDDRVSLLKESISDINQMMVGREELHKELINNLDKIELFVDNSIAKFDSNRFNSNVPDMMKELLKKKVEIQELKLQEKLNFWRDTALLKKELREHMKEYRDMESKTSMLDNILEV
jgi:hypothetical protein